MGYFKRCWFSSPSARSRSLTLDGLMQRWRDWTEPRPSQGLDGASALPRQDGGQAQMHQRHHSHQRVEPPRTDTLPASAPQYSQHRPGFLNGPTNSFFLVSTLITGHPRAKYSRRRRLR